MAGGQDLPAIQRALVSEVYKEPLVVKDVPTPEAVPGSAVIKVEAASVVSFQKEVFNGTRLPPYSTPMVPGLFAVGRVVATGPDAVALQPGHLVYFDLFIRGRDDPSVGMLSGLTDAGKPAARKLMSGEWRHSTYAQFAKVPLENCFLLNESLLCGSPASRGLGYSFEQIAWIGMPMVGYGGLRSISLQAGETIIIAPATGGYGGAATMAALSMGARVIAMGRNKDMMGRLEGLSPRVRTVAMSDDHDAMVEELTKHGRADAYLDLSPPAALSSAHLKSGIVALRKGGRASLMGGLFGDKLFPTAEIVFNDITLKGQWMYGRDAVRDVIKLVESGVLDLSQIKVAGKFGLEQWEDALDTAAGMKFDEVTVMTAWKE